MVGGAKEDEGVQEGEREGKEGEGGGGETGINAPGLLFIDAGSSGSKCTALPGDLSTLKGEKVDPPLAQMDVGTEEWAPDADGAKYRNLLAAKLKKEYALPEIHGGAFSTAANKNAVPVQATAGMRLIDQGANKAIWDKICNKEGTAGGDTVKFATAASKRCGTIPGTTEGYFEWVAANQARTGTICSGGASLQIATPFYAEEGVQAFKALIDDIEDEFSREAGVEVPSARLGALVMERLKPIDRVAYVRFASVYRNFQDAGEFQEFVDEMAAAQDREEQRRNQVELLI